MELNNLKRQIETAEWFRHLGQALDRVDVILLPDLAGGVADGMNWLPSSRSEKDPIHGKKLERKAEMAGVAHELRKSTIEIYKLTLVALRKAGRQPLLICGPHDFTGAANGAALFSVRRATAEIVLEEPGFWCDLLGIYEKGHWPLGRMPDGRLVVY